MERETGPFRHVVTEHKQLAVNPWCAPRGILGRRAAVGKSDKHAAYPAKDPVRPDDLAATIYHLLGIDPATEVMNSVNRPIMISSGKPVMDVVA